jgi:phospholipase C
MTSSEIPHAGVTRRQLLGTAGAAAAAASLPFAARASAAAPSRRRSDGLSRIEHIVIYMQENRSFDNYFGTLRGVRGFGDKNPVTLPTGKDVFHQPDAGSPDGFTLPFRFDTFTTCGMAGGIDKDPFNSPDVPHGWTDSHDAWNGGKMDGWIAAKGRNCMGYYTRDDLPYYYALADAFTICDNYYCSVMSSTNPNRHYSVSGTIDPNGGDPTGALKTGRGPAFTNREPSGPGFKWTTYPERLIADGVSFFNYQGYDNYDDNALAWYDNFQTALPGSKLYESGMIREQLERFTHDVRNDALPNVSFIITGAYYSEHPSYLPAFGATITQRLLAALAANPRVWKKTAVVLTFDEAGGFFDHVSPPVAPSGTKDEFIDIGAGRGLEPIGAGSRVPTIVISPYSAGGFVSSKPFDHTSLIRLCEDRFGVHETNISDWRRQTFGSLATTFDFDEDASPFPHLPSVDRELGRQVAGVQMLPLAQPGSPQQMPHQEPGHRPHR